MKLGCGILLCLLLLSGCSGTSVGIIGGADGPTKIYVSSEGAKNQEDFQMTMQTISQEEAKAIMDSGENYILLDVREQEEYDEGHIPGAVLMPYTQTRELAETLCPDQNALILVYCRSGRRSKIAAATLASMGYSDVREFGGIIDWPYGIE